MSALCQPAFNPEKMANAYIKRLQCLKQQMIVLLTTSLQLSSKLLTLCMRKQNTLKNMMIILVSKEDRIKKQLFSRQQGKSRKKRQCWFRNCRTNKW